MIKANSKATQVNDRTFEGWGAAYKLARRESRAGFRGFRIFAVALILGVFTIAAVGSLSSAFLSGLKKEQARLLGGDFEVSATDVTLQDDLLSWLRARGDVSETIDAQFMVHRLDGETRSVVQLKAVDQAYPLLGRLELSSDAGSQTVKSIHSYNIDEDGQTIWTAFADQKLFEKLAIEPGGKISIGDATFRVSKVIEREPDRASAGFLLAPRLIVSLDGARATGLLKRSGLVRRSARIKLFDQKKENFADALKIKFPENGWRVRSANDAARGLRRMLDNLDVFLTMVGLAALVIGGVGAANAVHAYMQRKLPVIATMKCIGLTSDFIMKTYTLQVLMVAIIAVFIGLVAGAAVPFVVIQPMASLLPFQAEIGVYLPALVRAGIFGVLAALTFALWPLAKARLTPPAQLFRTLVEAQKILPTRRDLGVIGLLSLLFFASILIFSKDRNFAFFFALSGFIVYGLLRLAAWGFVRVIKVFWKPKGSASRLAMASLTRPGSATGSVIVSIGLGLSLLATISLIDANLSREIRSALPDRAPGLFFSDIEFQDKENFDELIDKIAPNAEYERFMMLRSGIRLLNGKPLTSVEGAERSGWARQNDWGVTVQAKIPEELGVVTSGTPWPENYRGAPLISLSKWQAERFELEVGETITLTIAGRDVTATIATLHDVNWDRNGINFVAIFAPGTLEAARPTSIGSLRLRHEEGIQKNHVAQEDGIVETLSASYPDVTIIRTRDVTASVAQIIDGIGLVIRALSGVALLAGVIVLLGAVAADFRRKLKDAMIMKTLGAGRARILTAFAVEYALLGLIPAIAAVIVGATGSWFVVAKQMELDWQLTPQILFLIIGGTLFTTFTVGIMTAWKALGTRPWPILRSD